jgi:hypothetical protein
VRSEVPSFRPSTERKSPKASEPEYVGQIWAMGFTCFTASVGIRSEPKEQLHDGVGHRTALCVFLSALHSIKTQSLRLDGSSIDIILSEE